MPAKGVGRPRDIQGPSLAARGLGDLQGLISFLESSGALARVKSEVDATHELCGIAKKLEGSKAVLFEKVKGFRHPVITGLYWNRETLAKAFDCPVDRLPFVLADAVSTWQRSPVQPVVLDEGPATAVSIADLLQLPMPTHAIGDGGPYLSSSVVIARDPDTGVRNASIHRFMLAGKDRLTMLLDRGRHLRDYYERAEKRGEPLEITINNGVDLAVHMAAISPAAVAPIGRDELGIASQLLGKPLELVRGRTVGVEGIANAQFIIEGEMLPLVREPEGPFAEVTGYYAERDDRWVVRVKGITGRISPVFHTILSGKEVFNAVGLMGEAAIYRLVSSQVPDVRAVYLPHGGCGFYHAVVQVNKSSEGVQKNAIMATLAAFPSLTLVVAVDEDVNIYDAEDVQWAIATRFSGQRGLIVVPDARGHELNPSADQGIITKIGIDATAPFPRPARFQRVQVASVDATRFTIE